MSLSQFHLSADNPNQLGGCVCHPESKATDCQGPYVIFNRGETLEPGSPHIVLSSACARAAVQQLRTTPDQELARTGEATDFLDQLSRKEQATAEWDTLTDEEQKAAFAVGQPGEVVKLGDGLYVTVPGGPATTADIEPALKEPLAEPVPAEPDPLVQLAGADEPPQEEPGSRPHTYEDAKTPPAEDPVL